MTATTSSQRRILRLLAAGVRLVPPGGSDKRYALYLDPGSRPFSYLQIKSVEPMARAGWIVFDAKRNRYQLTDAGRAEIDVGAHVRSYADDLKAVVLEGQ